MTSIPIKFLIVAIGLWTVLGVLTAFDQQASSGLDDFEDFANSSLQPQEAQFGEISGGVGGTLDAAGQAASVATNGARTLTDIFKAATLQSSMWGDDWTSPIRTVLWGLMVILGLYITFEGVRLLQGFIPLT